MNLFNLRRPAPSLDDLILEAKTRLCETIFPAIA